MYAIIEDSGGQLMVRQGDVIDVDLRDLAANAGTVTFDKVLMLAGEGSAAKFGMPYLSGASVVGEIVMNDVDGVQTHEFKGEKLVINKYRRRKNSKRKQGHRQRFMKVRVTSIKG